MDLSGIALNEADGQVFLTVQVVQDRAPLESVTLLAWLLEQGYGNCLMHTEAIDQAARDAHTSQKPFVLLVAQRCDAAFQVQIAPDDMSAALSIAAARGGEAATLRRSPARCCRSRRAAGPIRRRDPATRSPRGLLSSWPLRRCPRTRTSPSGYTAMNGPSATPAPSWHSRRRSGAVAHTTRRPGPHTSGRAGAAGPDLASAGPIVASSASRPGPGGAASPPARGGAFGCRHAASTSAVTMTGRACTDRSCHAGPVGDELVAEAGAEAADESGGMVRP